MGNEASAFNNCVVNKYRNFPSLSFKMEIGTTFNNCVVNKFNTNDFISHVGISNLKHQDSLSINET